MRVNDFMTPQPLVVAVREPLRQVTTLVFSHRIPQLPVVDERNHLVGIITERDLLAAGQRAHAEDLVAEDVMTPDPETLTPASSIWEAVDIFSHKRYGAIPVVVGDRVVGLLTIHRLLRALGERVRSSELLALDR